MLKKKILIVDDEPDLIKVLKMRLESKGYEVISTYSGIRALKMAREEAPDLILLDILLPQMSGYRMLRNLRSSSGKEKNIPVIIISARGKMRELFENGEISGFIAKPFEAEELLLKVEKVLPMPGKKKITGTGKKALIIGDEPLVVEPVEVFLESREWTVFKASAGAEGIETAVEVQPNVIFVQFFMEGMNGFEVCRLLREMPGTKKIPALIFSSQDLEREKESISSDKNTQAVRYSDTKGLLEKIDEYLKKYIQKRGEYE